MVKVIFASINDKSRHVGTVYTMCTKLIEKPYNLSYFTPTKELAFGHKYFLGDTRFRRFKKVSDQEYILQYGELLKSKSQEVRAFIDSIQTDITICCFCKQGEFCHRIALAKWFKSYRPELEIQLY